MFKEYKRNSHKIKCTADFGRNVNTQCFVNIHPRNCSTQFFRKFLLYCLSQVQIARQTATKVTVLQTQEGCPDGISQDFTNFDRYYIYIIYQINLTCWVTSWILALTLYPTELHCRSEHRKCQIIFAPGKYHTVANQKQHV